MGEGNTGKTFFFIMDWLYKLVFLNCVWILFSLPIVTIIPATAAMFAVMDKWIKGDDHDPFFKQYYREFKRLLWKSWPLGLAIFIFGGLLLIDLLVLRHAVSAVFIIIRYALFVVSFIFAISILYSFPIFIRYQFSWYKTMLFSIMLGVRQPVITILGLCGILLIIVLVLFFTGIGLLFFASLFALISTVVMNFNLKSVIKSNE